MAILALSVSNPLLWALAIVFFLVVGTKVYTLTTHPLAAIPGPAHTKWTSAGYKIAVLKGETPFWVHQLHERYGPVVRVSPNEVSLATIPAAKAIYKMGSPYLKSEWYSNFTGNMPQRNLFTHIDPHAHGQHRRIVASSFAEKWVKLMEPTISARTKLAADRMADEQRRLGYCDVFKWFLFMATDVIGEASFGESFNMLESGKKDQYLHDVELAGARGVMAAEFPTFTKYASILPIQIGTSAVRGAFTRIQKHADVTMQRYGESLREDPENAKRTLLTCEFDAFEQGNMTMDQLKRDATGYMIAGTDTTANTATWAIWLLSHHPDVEAELIREVSDLPDGFTDEDLRKLPTLTGALNETLRLRTAVSQGLPRIVPPGGVTFDGHFIPEGTTVGIQPYTMHRLDDVWADADKFDPKRWEDPSKAMRDAFLPFGGGSRVCIGSHFAQLELRHALTNFYRNFDSGTKASAAAGFSDADMKPCSSFLVAPKGKRCLIERRK